jgi:Zn-dependent peptidase ImmA (M78 family)
METELINVIEEYEVKSVFELADVLGVSVRYDNLPKEIGGLYYINEVDNEIIILINKEVNKEVQLYICAYLISHHALDRGTYFCFLDKNSSNIQYYILALQLLRATVGRAAAQERFKVLS